MHIVGLRKYLSPEIAVRKFCGILPPPCFMVNNVEEKTLLKRIQQCSFRTNQAACHSLSNPLSMATSKSFIKANSQTELAGQQADRKLDRLDSLRGSVSDVMAEDTFGPLSNVRYASSLFCAYTLSFHS
jgi:hypothetical protein